MENDYQAKWVKTYLYLYWITHPMFVQMITRHFYKQLIVCLRHVTCEPLYFMQTK